jgi:hypothetical protein
MKRTAVCLALISLNLLFSSTVLQAAEQKIIFNTENIDYKSGTSSKMCQEMCRKKSGPDAKSLVSEGWRIVSSFPKKVIAEDYWYVPCNACKPHGCTCIGTEFTLQKDGPVTKAGIPKNELDAQNNNKQTGLHSPQVETVKNELELIREERDLLQQEITILKHEIETLKNQIKLQQGKYRDQP